MNNVIYDIKILLYKLYKVAVMRNINQTLHFSGKHSLPERVSEKQIMYNASGTLEFKSNFLIHVIYTSKFTLDLICFPFSVQLLFSKIRRQYKMYSIKFLLLPLEPLVRICIG